MNLGLIGKSLSHSYSKPYLEEKFVKENNINLKSENGIVSIFKYYDSLENPQ